MDEEYLDLAPGLGMVVAKPLDLGLEAAIEGDPGWRVESSERRGALGVPGRRLLDDRTDAGGRR